MQNQYEISWIDGIDEDFLEANLTENEVMKIKSKMDYVAQSPLNYSERIKGVPTSFLRRVKFGNYRLFIYLEDRVMVIYCLAFLPRKKCYDKVSLNRVLNLVKRISD